MPEKGKTSPTTVTPAQVIKGSWLGTARTSRGRVRFKRCVRVYAYSNNRPICNGQVNIFTSSLTAFSRAAWQQLSPPSAIRADDGPHHPWTWLGA